MLREPESEMTEQRSEKRRQLYSYLQDFDGINSRVIGHVADLTRKGLMLVSKESVGVRKEYRLRIKFPSPIGQRSELNVRAVCRWCRGDVNPEMFVAGFQFNELLMEEAGCVSSLLSEFSFQD